MLLGFGYLYNFMFFFLLFFFQKAYNNRLKKNSWPEFCNIIFLFLHNIGSFGPVDQQINLVSPYAKKTINAFLLISDHNLTLTQLKCTWKKNTNY